jgi:hypothetical protein
MHCFLHVVCDPGSTNAVLSGRMGKPLNDGKNGATHVCREPGAITSKFERAGMDNEKTLFFTTKFHFFL